MVINKVNKKIRELLRRYEFLRILEMYWFSIKTQKKSNNSFASEQVTLDNIISSLGIGSGYVVDIAASDGFTQSSTFGLFSNSAWHGLAVEMDSKKFSKLAYIYSKFEHARLARNKVTPVNVVDLLKSYEVPIDFEVLNLDIDSYDLHVINSLLLGQYQPKIVTMEINEKIPPGVYFTVDFHSDHFWTGDHFFGCSIDAAHSVLDQFEYDLVEIKYNNAFFVHQSVNQGRLPKLSPNIAYRNGYANQKDRLEIFPWNSEMDHWLELPSNEVLDEMLVLFANYQGRFTVHLS